MILQHGNGCAQGNRHMSGTRSCHLTQSASGADWILVKREYRLGPHKSRRFHWLLFLVCPCASFVVRSMSVVDLDFHSDNFVTNLDAKMSQPAHWG